MSLAICEPEFIVCDKKKDLRANIRSNDHIGCFGGKHYPMPKSVDHAARRQAFYNAAFRLIKDRGFQAATARAVAKEAGFTTGALQHYVQSMDDLLIQVAKSILAHVEPKA